MEHMFKRKFPTFPHHTQWRINILITKESFQTLMDIIIADSTHIYMVQPTLTTTIHTTMMGIQEKTWSYIEWALGDDFIFLAIETYHFLFIFDCLCLNHYRMSSTVFFSPLNVRFLISTTHVHSLATCVSHNNFSVNYCTWSGFPISSTHHS